MKKILSMIFVLLSLASFTFTACEGQTKKEEAREEIREAGDAVSEVFQEEKTALETSLKEAQISLNARIDKLGKNMEDASDNTRAEIQEQLDKLKIERRKVGDQLERFGDKMDKGWDDFKNEVEATIKEIDHSTEDK